MLLSRGHFYCSPRVYWFVLVISLVVPWDMLLANTVETQMMVATSHCYRHPIASYVYFAALSQLRARRLLHSCGVRFGRLQIPLVQRDSQRGAHRHLLQQQPFRRRPTPQPHQPAIFITYSPSHHHPPDQSTRATRWPPPHLSPLLSQNASPALSPSPSFLPSPQLPDFSNEIHLTSSHCFPSLPRRTTSLTPPPYPHPFPRATPPLFRPPRGDPLGSARAHLHSGRDGRAHRRDLPGLKVHRG